MFDKINTLTPEVLRVVCAQGTEPPHSGKYNDFSGEGTYLCRRCGLGLFRSDHKFLSSCGWPSFEDELPNAIKRKPDIDGKRTEILCRRCDAHLGHVFAGERLTQNNLRHCVNSLSIEFVSNTDVLDTEEGIYAGGCFWGMQYGMTQLTGVLSTEAGYTGGYVEHPSYEQVCGGDTGHVEAVRVIYNPEKLNYKTLTQYFFESHDPTQLNRQGPDIGEQYASVIFYLNHAQQHIAQLLVEDLRGNAMNPVTDIRAAATFWSAEDKHQNYYAKTGETPDCYHRVKRF